MSNDVSARSNDVPVMYIEVKIESNDVTVQSIDVPRKSNVVLVRSKSDNGEIFKPRQTGDCSSSKQINEMLCS